MVVSFFKKLSKRSPKHPIKRDEFGESARRRAFKAFDQGLRPAQVTHMVEISLRTACRYFADWKRQPDKFEDKYLLARRILSDPDLREQIAPLLAAELGMSVDQVLARMQKPWATKQLVTGRWRKWKAEE